MAIFRQPTTVFFLSASNELAVTAPAVRGLVYPDAVFLNGNDITWPLGPVLTVSPCSSQ